jgi:hemolysin activation/secretion protein
MTLAGAHYRIDYLTPYWDPEGGFRLDVTAAGGVPAFGDNEDFTRVSGQFSFVKGLPEGLGWLSETRLAGRIYGAAGWPDYNLYFTLGGAGLFRAFDMAERQGSAVWLGSVEWRVPLVKHLRWDCCDHAVGLRGISAVLFYDVGNAYVFGDELGDVAHGVGGGLYFDVAWFSFVERTTIRFDVAKSVNVSAPLQFNFYFQHPF